MRFSGVRLLGNTHFGRVAAAAHPSAARVGNCCRIRLVSTYSLLRYLLSWNLSIPLRGGAADDRALRHPRCLAQCLRSPNRSKTGSDGRVWLGLCDARPDLRAYGYALTPRGQAWRIWRSGAATLAPRGQLPILARRYRHAVSHAARTHVSERRTRDRALEHQQDIPTARVRIRGQCHRVAGPVITSARRCAAASPGRATLFFACFRRFS